MQLDSHEEPLLAQEESNIPEQQGRTAHGQRYAHEPSIGSNLDLGPLGNFLLARY